MLMCMYWWCIPLVTVALLLLIILIRTSFFTDSFPQVEVVPVYCLCMSHPLPSFVKSIFLSDPQKLAQQHCMYIIDSKMYLRIIRCLSFVVVVVVAVVVVVFWS